jgi:hypothetical protein
VQELVESKGLVSNVKVGTLRRWLVQDPERHGVRALTPWRHSVDATEVVVGSESEAERLHGWLNERGVVHVTVRQA